MLQEIYYTSAPRGLKAGSRGFCTVVSTPGMAKNLADRLEALSGYRHVFAPHDPQAACNPILWSHLRLSVGGRPYHVLSRIGDAGLDYTQRTNKFAHHVVLDAVDLPPAGPAWLLAAPGFMQSTWDGEPRTLAAVRRPPSGSNAPAVCNAWQQLTDDAGWGGTLAETALPDGRRQAVVVFAPGVDILPLVAESLALLPPALRWDVTFSTYFTKLPPGVECKWRFVVQGSPEAAAARATPQTLLINLCAPLPAAKGGALVETARTGVVSAIALGSAVDGGTVAAIAKAADARDEIGLLELDEAEGLHTPRAAATVGRPSQAGAYGIGPPPMPGPIDNVSGAPSALRKRKKKLRWGIIAGIGSMVLVTLGAVLMTFIMLRQDTHTLANNSGQTIRPDEKLNDKLNDHRRNKVVASEAKTIYGFSDTPRPPEPQEKVGADKDLSPDISLIEKTPENERPPAENSQQVPAATPPAFAKLPIPYGVNLDVSDRVQPQELFPLPEEPFKFTIEFGHWLSNGERFSCVPENDPSSPSRRWKLKIESTAKTGESAFASDERVIGLFSLEHSHLSFQWQGATPSAKIALKNSILVMERPNGELCRVFLRLPNARGGRGPETLNLVQGGILEAKVVDLVNELVDIPAGNTPLVEISAIRANGMAMELPDITPSTAPVAHIWIPDGHKTLSLHAIITEITADPPKYNLRLDAGMDISDWLQEWKPQEPDGKRPKIIYLDRSAKEARLYGNLLNAIARKCDARRDELKKEIDEKEAKLKNEKELQNPKIIKDEIAKCERDREGAIQAAKRVQAVLAFIQNTFGGTTTTLHYQIYLPVGDQKVSLVTSEAIPERSEWFRHD